MREVGRLSLALGAVALATLIGLAALAQLKFSAFLSDSIGERLEVVATTAAQDFASALDVGLAIDEVRNGSDILDRARAHDPDISGVVVFDLEGSVLRTTTSANWLATRPSGSCAMASCPETSRSLGWIASAWS